VDGTGEVVSGEALRRAGGKRPKALERHISATLSHSSQPGIAGG
jgi:hypothetical protein